MEANERQAAKVVYGDVQSVLARSRPTPGSFYLCPSLQVQEGLQACQHCAYTWETQWPAPRLRGGGGGARSALLLHIWVPLRCPAVTLVLSCCSVQHRDVQT